MTRLAAFELVLLAFWLGAAILVAAVLAPAAFRVLPSRTLAGALVGEVLPVIFASGMIIAVAALALQARSGGMPMRILLIGSFAAMLIGCGVAQFVVQPKIERVRATISGPVDALPSDDPRRVHFGKLHAFSVLCMGVAMLGAGVAVGTKVLVKSP